MIFPALMIALMILGACIPLLVFHFLVFPNIDGVIQDLSFYNYDAESQHFIYWALFWSIGISGALLGKGMFTTTEEKHTHQHHYENKRELYNDD